MSLKNRSKIGASIPIWAYVGVKPIPTVATPINVSVMTKVRLRPILSPICEKKTPPNGRIKNDNARPKYAIIVESVGLSVTKYCVLNTTLATDAYKKKSNHSIDDPTKLAVKTFLCNVLSISSIRILLFNLKRLHNCIIYEMVIKN